MEIRHCRNVDCPFLLLLLKLFFYGSKQEIVPLDLGHVAKLVYLTMKAQIITLMEPELR